MCGRFAQITPSGVLVNLFAVTDSLPLQPRYNIAPTQQVPVVRRLPGEAEPRIDLLRWGLIPSWAKDPAIGNRMINARAETVAEKPSYRNAYKHRRCLVLADGFYEWRRQGDTKTPYYISLASGEPFALAGLWEDWTDKESGESLQTTTLITTDANDFMTPLHHRMPVILEAATATDWLAGSQDLLDDVGAITPALQAWPVDRRVNNARNEGDELIRPAGDVLR
jgi:putative SOS response-associated peptidase YedK